MTTPPNPAKSEISNPEICDFPLAIGFRPRRHSRGEPPTRFHRPAFHAIADDSPSPGGEGRGEGGCTLFPQGLDLSPAPTGRNITAQGKAPRAAALGYAPPDPVSPEGAKPSAGQTRIAAAVERRMSVVEELEAVVSANLQRATRLRQSILQKAFAGQLT